MPPTPTSQPNPVIQIFCGTPVPESIIEPLRLLYEASFPPEERGPFHWLYKSPAEGSGVLYTLHLGSLAGLAYTYLLPDTQCAFLAYLAVQPGSRSQGLGGRLLDAVVQDCASRGVRGLLYEVESPQAAEGEEKVLRERRIGFYRRHGAHIVEDGGAYRIPKMDGEGSLAMRLMWLPTLPGSQPPFDGDLARLFTYVYLHAYNSTADDPLLLSVIADLPRNH